MTRLLSILRGELLLTAEMRFEAVIARGIDAAGAGFRLNPSGQAQGGARDSQVD